MAEKKSKKKTKKSHPWRLCPVGQHWVSTHPRQVSISEKNPDGITIVDGYCRNNPSRKDQLYSDEIHNIVRLHFKTVRNLPISDKLDRKSGNDYDLIIAGWTKYWNEVLKPEMSLDPNLVKALIRTESGFDTKAIVQASKGNWARGLMQITDQTIKILKDEKGELKNHLIDIDQKEAFDAVLNICAGVRWLFHKKYLLEHKLKRKVSWEEAVMEYKSFTKGLKQGKAKAFEQRDKFLKIYEKLKRKKK